MASITVGPSASASMPSSRAASSRGIGLAVRLNISHPAQISPPNSSKLDHAASRRPSDEAGGKSSPPTISRNSCRAAMWLIPTLSIAPVSEQRQPLGKQFAIDHPFAQARNDAKADALRKLVQCLADADHIACFKMLEPISQHDPIDRAAVGFRSDLAQIPDQFGIKAWTLDLERLGIDLPDQVKIDENCR